MTVYSIGSNRIDLVSRRVLLPNGTIRAFSVQTGKALQLFLGSPNVTIGHEALQMHVWGNTSVSENSRYFCVNSMKITLRGTQVNLKNIPKVGYILEDPHRRIKKVPRGEQAPILCDNQSLDHDKLLKRAKADFFTLGPKSALPLLEKCAAESPDPVVHYWLSLAKMYLGEYDQMFCIVDEMLSSLQKQSPLYTRFKVVEAGGHILNMNFTGAQKVLDCLTRIDSFYCQALANFICTITSARLHRFNKMKHHNTAAIELSRDLGPQYFASLAQGDDVLGRKNLDTLVDYMDDTKLNTSLHKKLLNPKIPFTVNENAFLAPTFWDFILDWEYFNENETSVGDFLRCQALKLYSENNVDEEASHLYYSYKAYQMEGNIRMQSWTLLWLSNVLPYVDVELPINTEQALEEARHLLTTSHDRFQMLELSRRIQLSK